MSNEKFRTTLEVDDYSQDSDRESKMMAWKKIGFGVAPHEQEDQFYVYGIMNANTIMNALVRLKAEIKEAITSGTVDNVLSPTSFMEVIFKFDSKNETGFVQKFQDDVTLLVDYYENKGEEPVLSFENQTVSVENSEDQKNEEQINTNSPEPETQTNQSGETVPEENKEVKDEIPLTNETPPAEIKNEEVPPTKTENEEIPERNIKIEVVNSGDLKLEDIIEIGPKGVSNRQMIPAMKKAVEEKSKEKLILLKATYPEIYESSIKYIGNKRQQELKTIEEEIAKAQ